MSNETVEVAGVKFKACRCGCEIPVTTGALYKPGHDARHAGQVARKVAATGNRELLNGLPSMALQVKASDMIVRLQAKPAKAKPYGQTDVLDKEGNVTDQFVKIGRVRRGRWEYPARKRGTQVERNSRRDGQGEWVYAEQPDTFVPGN